MRMPALPQSKVVNEKKVKKSLFKSIRTLLSNRFGRKQKSFRLPPRE